MSDETSGSLPALEPLRALTDASNARTTAELMAFLAAALGADALYSPDHGLKTLVPLFGSDRRIPVDRDLLDALGRLRPYRFGDRLLVPLPDLAFPLLVAEISGSDAGKQALVADYAPLCGIVFGRYLGVLDQVELLRRRKNMTVASEMQWELLSTRGIEVDGYSAAAVLEPAYEVAGDACDLAISPAGRLTAVVLDAMGHGVTATLSAVLAVAAIRNSRRDGGDLAAQAAAADAAVREEWGGDRFVTMAAIEVDADMIRVVNAGHEPLRRLGPGGASVLDVSADPPLGVLGPTRYRVQDVEPLAPGESIAMLSDGASSARSGSVRLGSRGVDDALVAAHSSSPLATATKFTRAILDLLGERLEDDITAVVVSAAALPQG